MMHKQFSLQIPKTLFALLAISTVGLTTLPANADEALIQETVQESYTTGEGNVSVQSSRQQNRQHSDNRGRHYDNNNVGIVQRSQQLCDQFGEGNACVQDAEQRNVNRQHRNRW